MDIFVEQLVKKKRGIKEIITVLASIIGALVILWFLPVAFVIPGIGFALFAVCVILMYLLYFLVTSINQEYEYCFTNGILDVDKIINMRKRKKMLEINVRKMEMMGTKKSAAFQKYMTDSNVKKIYACTHKEAEDLCFLVFPDESGKNMMLLFNPNEKIADAIRRYNPQKVEL